jgi:hypothetical protein
VSLGEAKNDEKPFVRWGSKVMTRDIMSGQDVIKIAAPRLDKHVGDNDSSAMIIKC